MKNSIYIFLLLLFTGALAACANSTPASADPSTSNNGSSLPTQAADTTSTTRVNLNTAAPDDFVAAVPGLGNRMVREFMEYRPYISIQQFRREIGKYVDDAQVAEYEKYVYVPIAINDSDSETLQQIPGLSADEVESLISARPFESTDAFLAKLSEYISAGELEVARSYLGGN